MPKAQTEEEVAVATLQALAAVPGALRIITAEVQTDLRRKANDPRSEAKESVDVGRPESYVIHDVVRIEGPNHRGLYSAFSDEGDFTIGRPEALLRRLQQWRE